jgi:TP901 family phage tail tape measure protein
MATIATLNVRLTADTASFKKDLSGAQKVAQTFKSGLQTLGKVAIAGAIGGVTTAVGGFAAVTKATLPLAADFQGQLAGLQIAAGDSGKSFAELHDMALAVGGDTRLLGVSATGAADAMTGLYKAGLSTTEIFGDVNAYMEEGSELGGALRAAIDLAAASELDMVQASDLGAVALSTFGSGLETAEQRADFVNSALDNMVRAADASVAEVSGLAGALKNVGPVAAGLGLSIEETNNALAILSTRGIQGSEAGTALKSMLTNLQRPTTKVQEAMDELGVSLYDAQGNFVGMPNMIGQLETAFADLTQEERNLYAQTLAGTYGMNAFNALIGEGTQGWNDMAEATANAAGIQEQAATKAATLRGMMEGLEGAVETAKIRIGEALIPAATSLVETFSTLVEEVGPTVTAFFTETLGPALQTAVGFLQGFVGALLRGDPAFEALQMAAESVGFDALAETIGVVETKLQMLWAQVEPVVTQVTAWVGKNVELKDVLIGLGVAVASVVVPAVISLVTAIGPVILVFVAVTAAVAALRKAWETNFLGIRDKTQAVIEWIKTNVPIAVQAVVDAWEWLKQAAQTVATFVTDVIDWFKQLYQRLVGGSIIPEMMTAIENVITAGLDAVLSFWKEIWTTIQDFTRDTWEAMRETIQEKIESAQATIEEIWTAVQTFWETTWEAIQTFTETVWEAIRSWVQEKAQATQATIEEIWTAVQGFWESTWEAIQTFTETVWEAIRSWVEEKVQAVQTAIETTINDVQTFWETTWQAIHDFVEALWNTIKSTIEAKAAEVLSTVRELVNGIKEKFTSINWKEIGGAIIDGIKSGISSAAGKLAQAAKNAAKKAYRAAKRFLGISCPDPSPVTAELGIGMGEGMVMGILSTVPAAEAAMATLAESATASAEAHSGGFATLMERWADDAEQAYGAAMAVANRWADNVDVTAETASAAVNHWADNAQQAYGAATATVDAWADNVQQAYGAATATINTWADNVHDAYETTTATINRWADNTQQAYGAATATVDAWADNVQQAYGSATATVNAWLDSASEPAGVEQAQWYDNPVVPGMAAVGGASEHVAPSYSREINLTAQYGYQEERRLRDDVRFLEMMYG